MYTKMSIKSRHSSLPGNLISLLFQSYSNALVQTGVLSTTTFTTYSEEVLFDLVEVSGEGAATSAGVQVNSDRGHQQPILFCLHDS